MGADVSEAAAVCMKTAAASSKFWCASTKLHVVIFLKTIVLIFTVMRDSEFRSCVFNSTICSKLLLFVTVLQ
jgi:hypothetical protein